MGDQWGGEVFVLIKLPIIAQPGRVKPISECYGNGSILCVCVYLFTNLHIITLQPGHVVLIVQYYRYVSIRLWFDAFKITKNLMKGVRKVTVRMNCRVYWGNSRIIAAHLPP